MLSKNKIISLLLLTLAISTPHALYSMKNDDDDDNQKQQEELSKQNDITLLKQKNKLQELEILLKDERTEFEKKRNEQITANNKFTLEKEQFENKQKENELNKAKHDQEKIELKDKLEQTEQEEKIKQAIAATEAAKNNNSATRQISIAAIKSLTDGAATGAGNCFVAAVQKELDFLYSQYRPTQATLLAETDAAEKIIQQGQNNVTENHERQLKLINSSHKDPRVVTEKIRILNKETLQAYEDLKKMAEESRRRLTESYGYRNPEFKKSMNEPTPNIFDEPTPNPKDPNAPPAVPKPGRIKRITNFIAEKSVIAADVIANTLPINAHLDELTKTEQFKNSWVNTYKTEISRAAALGLVATTLAILYKSYSWYTNEDRRLACEAIVQLEEQKEQIALQFAKEMNKPTVSAEDKAKLQIAYNNYMQDLQVEIDEQRAIAGYNIPKKLLIGTTVLATGIAGIIAFTKYRVDITDMITLAKNYFSDQFVASTNPSNNNTPETTHHTIIDTAPEQQKENTNDHTANDNSDTKKQLPKLRLKGHP